MEYLRQLCLTETQILPQIFGRDYSKGSEKNMNFSTTYHPDYDGKVERVNQVIEDMLRMYVMEKPYK